MPNRHFLLPLSLSFGLYLTASSAYGSIETWNYGEQWLKFQGRVVVAISENKSNSLQSEGHGCKAK